MSDLVTDTHALIWYLEDSQNLSVAANEAFDKCDGGEITIYIPTICLVEIVYLQERRRISADMKYQLDTALASKRGASQMCKLYQIQVTNCHCERNVVE
ncbi:MAG: PIN domain nuclease [Nostoc sp.]|uniref:PIN domain nuclease n=1 Tax=Nostoc sp. TaxID=1180 RepID=UPI002FFC5C2A